MTRSIVLACLLVATGGTAALAQPGEPPVAPEPPTPPAPPEPPQPPRPPQPPSGGSATVTADIEPAAASTPAMRRPDGFSIGIGVGYRFPTSLQTPNTSSVRLRVASGVTVEPSLVFATTSHTVDMGSPMGGSATEFGAGAVLRLALVQRGRMDLELLGGVDLNNVSIDPNDDNPDDVRSTTTVRLLYGLAVGAWITKNFQASLSATNGLLSYTKLREEQGFDTLTITSDTTIGLIFDPTVTFMLHLYN